MVGFKGMIFGFWSSKIESIMEEFKLCDEQILMLNIIYNKRKNLLLAALTSLPCLITFYPQETFKKLDLFTITYGIVILSVIVVILVLFFLRLNPIKKDINEKSGVINIHKIIRKTNFSYANKYYFFFEDIKFPNKEVTENEFKRFSINDNYGIPIAKHSKIIVDGFMNYKLL